MKKSKNIRIELKIWGYYFSIVLLVTFLHELGHSIVAWVNGYTVIPTVAKEYSLTTIPAELNNYVSLGGVIVSIFCAVAGIIYFINTSFKYASPLLAGTLAMPFIYTLRFIIEGRGHDATEFQEAQMALKLNYSGHFLDWLFLIIAVLGAVAWFIKTKPNSSIVGRLLIGAIATILFIVVVQVVNNLIFDPVFS